MCIYGAFLRHIFTSFAAEWNFFPTRRFFFSASQKSALGCLFFFSRMHSKSSALSFAFTQLCETSRIYFFFLSAFHFLPIVWKLKFLKKTTMENRVRKAFFRKREVNSYLWGQIWSLSCAKMGGSERSLIWLMLR